MKNNFQREFEEGDLADKIGVKSLNNTSELYNLQRMEYWKVLGSGQSWDLSFGGLIPFVCKCFYQMQVANLQPQELLDAQTIRKMLQKLLVILQEMEQDFVINISKYTFLLSETIDL